MCSYNDKLTVSLFVLPFVLVLFVVGAVLINTNKIFINNKMTNTSLMKGSQKMENIWIQTKRKKIKTGENFSFDVFINTNHSELGAFAFDLKFPKANFIVDVSKGSNGLDKGRDASNFLVMSNPDDIIKSHFRFSGICAKNCANGKAQHIATIYAKALSDFNLLTRVNWLEVKELSDTLGHSFEMQKFKGNVLIKITK